MKIALLGYGKEGKSAEKYFNNRFPDAKIDIFENFTNDEIKQKDYSSYDIIIRSPSVHPLGLANESSVTQYFFDHCSCPIIAVTASKGKGTICSIIKSLLDALNINAYLVGNIGVPALDILDSLPKDSVVIYEISSFQLWNLTRSPHIAVLGILEPEHLNIHDSYEDYLTAKSHIFAYQSKDDYLIYNSENETTAKLVANAVAKKIPYPFSTKSDILNELKLPGSHNQANALAAIAAVASFLNISPNEYLSKFTPQIKSGLHNFTGLPHRLKFLRELNGVRYYDDNLSTTEFSLSAAVKSFPNDNLVIIVGGRDKTANADLPKIVETLNSNNVKKVILIGESGHAIYQNYQDPRFTVATTLKEAVTLAKAATEKIAPSILLMSPAAASFDMFKNAYDRGAKFEGLVKNLMP